MKFKQLLFVTLVAMLAVGCISVMNMRYDRLSRYPYDVTDEQRYLIERYLDDDGIEYIIQHSIYTSEFIDYISYPNFNIYRTADYNYVRDAIGYYSADIVVLMVESTYGIYSREELVEYLISYNYDSLLYYVRNGDIYNPESELIKKPYSLTVYLDNYHTISTKPNYNLVAVEVPTLDDEEILVDKNINTHITAMCNTISEELGSKQACAGIKLTEGYISYAEQVEIYDNAVLEYGDDAVLYVDYPGHSEHQLGTAFDIVFKGSDTEEYKETEQYIWLLENAHRFGFVQTYTEKSKKDTEKLARPFHFRYVGVDAATTMYENNLTLKEVSSWQE